jgi:hypothetical protein
VLDGAPWRELCAEVMHVNGITVEEIEFEVHRRLNRGREILTKDQQEQLDQYTKNWEILASPPRPPRLSDIEVAVSRLYESAKLKPPKLVFCESPAMLWHLTHYLGLKDLPSDKGFAPLAIESVGEVVETQSESFERRLIEVSTELFKEIQPCLGVWQGSNFEQIYKHMHYELIAWSNESLSKEICGYLRFGYGAVTERFMKRFKDIYALATLSAESWLRNRIDNSLIEGIDCAAFGNVTARFVPNSFGIWDASDLLAFGYIKEQFLDRNKLQSPLIEILQIWLELFRFAPWYSFFENICFVGAYPTSVSFDAQFRLNDRNGPALMFADGFEVFALDGVWVPKHLFEHPETIWPNDDIDDLILARYPLYLQVLFTLYKERTRRTEMEP